MEKTAIKENGCRNEIGFDDRRIKEMGMKKIVSTYLIFAFMLMTFSGCERIKNSLGLSSANAEIPDNSNKSESLSPPLAKAESHLKEYFIGAGIGLTAATAIAAGIYFFVIKPKWNHLEKETYYQSARAEIANFNDGMENATHDTVVHFYGSNLDVMLDYWSSAGENDKFTVEANLADSVRFINNDNRLNQNDKTSMFNRIRSLNIPNVDIPIPQ